MTEKTIICRCEDLSVEEIREWIDQGYDSFEEIKRISRIGMGACQGRTCRRHLLKELAKSSGREPAEIELPTFRPPTKPVQFGSVLGVENDEKDS
ncbi:MAG: (2Fe-2S)-binding protein [Bacillota bacterium]